jgi:hypothetical protein
VRIIQQNRELNDGRSSLVARISTGKSLIFLGIVVQGQEPVRRLQVRGYVERRKQQNAQLILCDGNAKNPEEPQQKPKETQGNPEETRKRPRRNETLGNSVHLIPIMMFALPGRVTSL